MRRKLGHRYPEGAEHAPRKQKLTKTCVHIWITPFSKFITLRFGISVTFLLRLQFRVHCCAVPTTPQITAASLLCFLPATWCNYLFLLEKYDGERKYCTNWAKRFLVAKVGPLVVVSMGRAAKRNAQSSIFLLYNTMLWVADLTGSENARKRKWLCSNSV